MVRKGVRRGSGRVLARFFAGICFSAGQTLAQTPSVEPGVIQKEFEKPVAPLSVGEPVVSASAQPEAPPGAALIRFHLVQISFGGATVFPETDLQAFAADLIGREISVADLYELAARITRRYTDRGYALSIAAVPEQEITDGRVRIAIIEGHVAEIEIAGDPGKARGLLLAHAEKLKADRPLRAATLERYLLLANDIPGLNVRAIFDKSPAANGGVKLVIDAKRWRYDAAGGVNNRGSRALGRLRGVVSLAENGAVTGRERIGVDFVKAFDARELTYLSGRASYRLNSEGTSVAIAGTFTQSEPGAALLSALNFTSDGWTALAEIEHPVLRSRSRNLRLTAGFEAKSLDSSFGAAPNSSDRLRVLFGAAVFDMSDASGAINQMSVTVRQGIDVFDATEESDPVKSRGDGSGVFTSVAAEASRLQPVVGGLELYVAGGGQLSSRPLLASEECGYGGSAIGRAFDNYEIAGEHCLQGLIELRYTHALQSAKSRAQPFAYYDAGSVWQRGALLAGEDRRRTGQSVGGGVRFWFGDHLYADVEYAKPLTRDVALEADADGRVFFTLWAAR